VYVHACTCTRFPDNPLRVKFHNLRHVRYATNVLGVIKSDSSVVYV
jgi:hypothetical protein